jgi:hypothetical protein
VVGRKDKSEDLCSLLTQAYPIFFRTLPFICTSFEYTLPFTTVQPPKWVILVAGRLAGLGCVRIPLTARDCAPSKKHRHDDLVGRGSRIEKGISTSKECFMYTTLGGFHTQRFITDSKNGVLQNMHVNCIHRDIHLHICLVAGSVCFASKPVLFPSEHTFIRYHTMY